MARYEIGKRAESGDPHGFTFERSDAGDRRSGEKRGLSGVVLAADHRQIGAGETGVDHGAGGGINNVDVATEQRLHRFGAGADVE